MATNSKIRICKDCKRAPAKGIRSSRCVECDIERKRQKTREWNAKRSAKARADWSPVCEYDGCTNKKRNNRYSTKWCEEHLRVIKKERQREYKERVRQHKIENPGQCQNPGCNRDAYSYKAKYCTRCRKEVNKAHKRGYALDKAQEHSDKNVLIVTHVRDQLNLLINDSAQSGDRLDTSSCHRLGTILLQLRAWNS
jgi:hypothetical protein